MGLVEETQKMANFEYRKAQQEAEKATEKAKKIQKQLDNIKEQKQTQKEYERDLNKAIEKDMRNAFIKVFETYGTEKAIIFLNLKSVHDDILDKVPESELEFDFASKNYYKILKQVQEIYIKDQNAKRILKQQQEEKENAILNIVCFVITLPFKILKWILLFFAMIFFNLKTK